MSTTFQGYLCPRCGNEKLVDIYEVKLGQRSRAEPVYTIDTTTISNPTVNQECPSCASLEAYKVVLSTQGEHAGVKQDRFVERYTCVECGYSWIKT
jgi:DNA-directed RNA polymerase subunit M/transcription elongation factor TFIIS